MAKKKEWKLKIDEDSNAVVLEDGKPVYIDPDGKELALDGPQMYEKIIVLGRESKGHRESKEELVKKLKIFEGIDDLTDWKTQADEALEKIANFNDKDWLKTEKVEQLKKEMSDSYTDKLAKMNQSWTAKETDFVETIKAKDGQMRKLLIDNLFANSPLFSGQKPKTTLPPAIAATYFGKNFKMEEDEKTNKIKLVAYHDGGDVVLSRENPGEIADLNEAMTAIFEASPFKDQLLVSSGGGSGAGGGGGGGDENPQDKLAALQAKHKEAVEKGDGKLAISLKSEIFRVTQAATS